MTFSDDLPLPESYNFPVEVPLLAVSGPVSGLRQLEELGEEATLAQPVVISERSVAYRPDSAAFLDEAAARAALEPLAEYLLTHPETSVVLYSTVAGDSDNRDLSAQRSQAVEEVLATLGVDSDRVRVADVPIAADPYYRFGLGTGEEPGPDRAVRVPLRRYGRDRGVVESMCKLVEEYLGQAGPATVVILDDGRGDRSFLAPFLAALPGTAEAHLLSWDLFSLPEPELAPVLSAFPVRVYSRHESGASCARVAAQCGQLEVVKCSSSVTVDHRLGAASAWDLLLGTNRTTTQVRNAPVKEYRFRPEVVQSLGPGMGIIDCGGQHTLFQF